MKQRALINCIVLTIVGCTNAQADVITEWNMAALDAIRFDRTSPPVASRALAILHASIYDAVNGISRRHETYFVSSQAPASASREAAAIAAAHKVLSTLFPTRVASFERLHAVTLAAIRNGPQKARSVAWGESVADQILAWRMNDGAGALVAPPSGSGPGDWQPTPPAFAPFLLPQWGFVTPFAIPVGFAFRPPGPPPLDSAKWAADYNEIKEIGAATSTTRTAEQTEIAEFWADGAGTETPPGHWNSIAQNVAGAAHNTLEENARLFALLNLAMADAAICAWDAKYVYNFWRPITAIRNGDMDRNDATAPDPDWISLIVTPPFPDYTSGHSTFSGAAATVLALFYGSDSIVFASGSDSLPGVFRTFTSFSAAAHEAALSRLYGGIHYRFANNDGSASGIAVGMWTFRNYLQPKNNRSRK